VVPPPFPVQVVAQQILALCLQHGQITRQELHHHFGAIPPLTEVLGGDVLDELLGHLVDKGYLVSDQGLLSLGLATEQAFGRRHYLALLSVFEAQSTYAVRFGKADIGQLQSLSLRTNLEKYPFITLSGRGWHVTHLDDLRRLVYVEPSEMKGKSRWFGPGQSLSYAFCQSMRAFLSRDADPDYLSARGKTLFGDLKEEFAWVRPDRTILLGRQNKAAWWPFAGFKANLLAAKRLEPHLDVGRVADCWVELRTREGLVDVARRIKSVLGEQVPELQVDPEEGKFSELLPATLSARQALLRSVDRMGLARVVDEEILAVT
jgi:ATP-dependent Lhr-like helicase